MYHLKPKCCYSTYILKSKRSAKSKSEPELVEEVEEGGINDSYNVAKRRKKSYSSSYKDIERKCDICDRVKESCGDRGRVLYRISESDRAASFLDALNFYKDEVKTRCDVFAADVFYHGTCLLQYLLKYNRQIDALFENIQRSNEAATLDLNCKFVFDSLDFKTSNYSVSQKSTPCVMFKASRNDAALSDSEMRYSTLPLSPQLSFTLSHISHFLSISL
ncbi:hypothetical protein SNE40_008626 [Patella caerulea]|uniref:Uncharacterized protein n=1 Tax=Patella caerulea TaxID=87958 RepID=A0AAN8JPI8_PATCE